MMHTLLVFEVTKLSYLIFNGFPNICLEVLGVLVALGKLQ